jgi:hypothetical protein
LIRNALILLCALGFAANAQEGAERLDPATPIGTIAPTPIVPAVAVPAPPDTTRVESLVKAAKLSDSLPTAPDSLRTDSLAKIQGPALPVKLDTIPKSLAVPVLAPPLQQRMVVVGLDTNDRKVAKKSVWAAVGLSLLLPGAGEQYLGATGRARFFFTTELFYVAAAYISWRNQEDAMVSARELANRYAGAQADGKSLDYLELMSQYRSRRPVGSRHDSYDEAMLLSGQSPERQFANVPEYTWDWGSTENPENDSHLRSFESQLRVYRASRVALSFSVGAMAVSRLVSLADVLWLRRRAAWVDAEITPTIQGAAGRLAWRF